MHDDAALLLDFCDTFGDFVDKNIWGLLASLPLSHKSQLFEMQPMQILLIAAFVRGDDEDTVHDDATWLLDFYDTFKDFVGNDVLDLALNSLANVEGRFGEGALRPLLNIVCNLAHHAFTRKVILLSCCICKAMSVDNLAFKRPAKAVPFAVRGACNIVRQNIIICLWTVCANLDLLHAAPFMLPREIPKAPQEAIGTTLIFAGSEHVLACLGSMGVSIP